VIPQRRAQTADQPTLYDSGSVPHQGAPKAEGTLPAKNTTRLELDHRRSTAKLEERRSELAMSALSTIARRGFANTSLRDIANDSPYSSAVLHYYFADKWELVAQCLAIFSEDRAALVAAVLDGASTAESFRTRLAKVVTDGIRKNSDGYVMWYDLRSQVRVSPELADAVARIEEGRMKGAYSLSLRHAELMGSALVISEETNYALGDGLVQRAVNRHAAGERGALAWLAREIPRFLMVSAGATFTPTK
jgi:TetR/AcrR family transcriptional regulator, transcriptional repressor of bet genes